MMINNNQMINQMDKNQMLQMIQKNNEEIIQMIQQIFQVQMLNNMILNQILNNNLNNNNNFNGMMNQINNLMNNNPNMQNMMDNDMINMINSNDNGIDPWAHIDISKRISVAFRLNSGKKYILHVPKNIIEKELVEGFIKKSKIKSQKIQFICNGRQLKKDGCRKVSEAIQHEIEHGLIVFVID